MQRAGCTIQACGPTACRDSWCELKLLLRANPPGRKRRRTEDELKQHAAFDGSTVVMLLPVLRTIRSHELKQHAALDGSTVVMLLPVLRTIR